MSGSGDGDGVFWGALVFVGIMCVFIVFCAIATSESKSKNEWRDISDLKTEKIYIVETFKEKWDIWAGQTCYYFTVKDENNTYLSLKLDTMPQGYYNQGPQFGDKIIKTRSGVVVKVP